MRPGPLSTFNSTRFPGPSAKKGRNDAIFNVVVKLIVCHPSLLIHSNRCRKDPLLLKTKPPTRASDVHQKMNLDPLPFPLSHTCWELPVQWHAFTHCVATKNPSAPQQGLGNGPIYQREVCPCFAPIKQNLCLVDVDDLPKHCLVKNQLVNSNSNGGGAGGGSGCTGQATA